MIYACNLVCGQARQDGCQSRVHTICSTQSKFKDPQVQPYCNMKEKYRWTLMLSCLGSTEHISSSELHPNVCFKGKVPYVCVDVMSECG